MKAIARRAALTAAVVSATLAVPAVADQGNSVSLSPAVAGKGSTATLDVTPPHHAGDTNPQSVVVRVARGFKFDPVAVSARCDQSHAKANTCPAKSKIGGGTADITVSTSAGLNAEKLTAAVDMFVAPPPQAGDVSGVVVHFKEPQTGQQGSVTGRIVKEASGQFGLDSRFDGLDQSFKPPAGFKVRLDHLHVTFGASRTVKKTVKKHGKKKTKKVRHNLVTNAPTCSGSWPYEVQINWSDQPFSSPGSVACSAH
jgi:hypothetical protein